MKKIWILMIAFLLVSCINFAKEQAPMLGTEMGELNPDVVAQVEELFVESGIPSMALAIVGEDELLWAKGYGEQSDLSTAYMVGSIDKAYVTTAFLGQVEDGLIGLEDDISDYLPFELRNPNDPDVPITPRMLVSHQSGLAHDVPGLRYVDNDGPMLWWRFWNLEKNFWDLWYAIIPFGDTRFEVVEKALEEGDPDEVWSGRLNEGFQYSNTGLYDILGRAVGGLQGGTYQDVVRRRVFEPLELKNTSFEASSFPKQQLAIPYARFENGYRRMPVTGLSASGRLRSNVLDLARFMALHMNDGALEDVKILSSESIVQMHARDVELSGTDFPSMELYGFGWGWLLWGGDLMGHTGAVPGFYSQMVYRDVKTPYGVVLMMNTGCSVVECDFQWFDDYFVAIREILMEEAARLVEGQ
ncbi:MAG: serine hydrolase domain-containing protein [Anaerolineales bacterium]|jgi:CubicO group peptidase (beta-lactamase class C family)